MIRLVASEDLPSQTKYLTLSHRWGKNMPLTLTATSLLALQRGILISMLPPTFRDAVNVAARLSVPYLWIDTLCIRQDSNEDWAAQAKDMAAVYSNSYLNIAATDSADSYGGLFRYRNPEDIQSFEVRLKTGANFLCYQNTFIVDVSDNSFLGNRAWVVQERFLSPRVLHFGKRQVHWECIHGITSENLTAGLSFLTETTEGLKSLSFSLENLETEPTDTSLTEIYHIWDRLLDHYTGGNLTYSSDKAIAAHALALTICRHLGHDVRTAYVNGIWRDEFINGICWYSFGNSPGACHHVEDDACSWSWLSMTGRIASAYQISRTKITCLIDVQADCTLFSPTTVAGGYASVRGPLCMAIMRAHKLATDRYQRVRSTSYSLEVGGKTIFDGDEAQIYPDNDDPRATIDESHSQLYLLLCRAFPLSNTDPWQEFGNPYYEAGSYECLLLEPVKGSSGYFRRVGFAMFRRPYVDATLQEIRAMDLATCRLLDSQFRRYDVPSALYHNVDDDFMYTITLV